MRGADWDALYRAEIDPWNFETSPYERRKALASVRALGRGRYASGLEVGCSIGVLSQRLAARCLRFTGIDPSRTAIARARARGVPRARFMVGAAPHDWPQGRFDLVVLSEVLYFLDVHEIRRLARRLTATAPGATCLVVTWGGRTANVLPGRVSETVFLIALGRHVVGRRRLTGGGAWTATLFTVGRNRMGRRQSGTAIR